MAANRVNSKNKGGKFEREIAKLFTDWTGYEFSRVPASGGLRWKKADNISGDITCSDPEGISKQLFSVECKFHKEISFEHILLGNKKCKILEFWEQACNDAERCNKNPMLIMRYNGMPKNEAFVVLEKSISNFILDTFKILEKSYMGLSVPNGDGTFKVFYVFMLSDILQIPYKKLFRKWKRFLKKKRLEELPF